MINENTGLIILYVILVSLLTVFGAFLGRCVARTCCT